MLYVGCYLKIYCEKNIEPVKVRNLYSIKVSSRNCFILIPNTDLDSSTIEYNQSDYKNLTKINPYDEVLNFVLAYAEEIAILQKAHGNKYVTPHFGVVHEIE